jgi:hypothetical protein
MTVRHLSAKTAKTTPGACTTGMVMLPWDAATRLKFGSCRRMDPPKLRIAPPRIQGRVGAPSLTHLRGNAAIESSRDAASQLKFGTPRAWQLLPWVTNRAAARKRGARSSRP